MRGQARWLTACCCVPLQARQRATCSSAPFKPPTCRSATAQPPSSPAALTTVHRMPGQPIHKHALARVLPQRDLVCPRHQVRDL